jgi:hypothetical protein
MARWSQNWHPLPEHWNPSPPPITDQPSSSQATNVVIALPPAVQDRTGLQALNNYPSVILHEEWSDECQYCGGGLHRYLVKGSDGYGNILYEAIEQSDLMSRKCCGHRRSLSMVFFDAKGEEVFRLDHPKACGLHHVCCCFCGPCVPNCWHKVDVKTPSGNFLGSAKEHWSCCGGTEFCVRDPFDRKLFYVVYPRAGSCQGGCYPDIIFEIHSADRQYIVGNVILKNSCYTSCCTTLNTYELTFPPNVTAETKATLIGATFLIDYTLLGHQS